MTESVAGICGNCGGLVIAAVAHHGKLVSPARCAQCGAEPENKLGATIKMGPSPVPAVARIMQAVSRR